MPKQFHEYEYQTLVVLNEGEELNEDTHDAIGIITGEIPSTSAVLRERGTPRCIFYAGQTKEGDKVKSKIK